MANNQKSIIKISLNKEKLTAVKTFLERKNLKLEEEFEQFFDTLFKKYVPKDVQIYIESMSCSAPKITKKQSQKDTRIVETSSNLQENLEEVSTKNESKITAEEKPSQLEKSSPLPPIPNRFDRFKD